MKRKRIILITLISLAALILISAAIILFSGNMFTAARCIVTDNGALFMIFDGRPVKLSGADGDFQTGDKLLILHAAAFAESDPEQARAVAAVRIGEGSIDDVPESALKKLSEYGYSIEGYIPTETDLEFWIEEDVTDFDFSCYLPKYGIFGGYEYYGTGYEPTVDADGQQTDPEHCVIYTVTNYPDYSINSLHVTCITITDPAVAVYGLTLASSAEEITETMSAKGFAVTETAYGITAKKDNITFSFSENGIIIRAEVTNENGIVY